MSSAFTRSPLSRGSERNSEGDLYPVRMEVRFDFNKNEFATADGY
ncbi:hypothetical protein DYBT9275_05881 [Dyadobacter sp. CECT 9275]|uniref:Uncharacterized protein n=1 Tax=Dyadobacter helix TaxID=2822344 RepID=A0A916JJ14_9BACT|nr:hypothetical protein DYBT9275_05881 [Dyadobacter sp. CECT 9275]